MPDSALQPVAEAVVGRLNVASLTAAAPGGAGCVGGVTEDPAQGGRLPFLWYEVSGRDISGLGQGADLTEIDLRLHVFSAFHGMSEARRIMREAIRLVKFSQPVVAGYQMPPIGRPHEETPLPFEELNGVKVRELVASFTVFAEQL